MEAEVATTITLTQAERDALADVLEPNYGLTRKNTPALQPLSMYSSELKGLKQIANLLKTVSSRAIASKFSVVRQ
jgi:hypothetical protein